MKKINTLLISLVLLTGLAACERRGNAGPDFSSNNLLVTEVTLDQSGEVIMNIGDILQVTPTITYKNDQKVEVDTRWVSSNPRVAKVDNNGLVTALSGGTTVITYVAGYQSTNFKVTINSDEIVVPPSDNQIVLSAYSRTLEKGTSFQLSASLSNGETPESVTFKSDNTAVATVSDSGLVTGSAEGTANILVTANELSAKCVVTVIEQGQQPEDEDYDFTVYFFIDYNNIDEKDTTGTKLLASFGWYHGEPIANSHKVPANPTQYMDPAFPYFVGWSTHTIIDTKDDLIDVNTYVVENDHFLFIYGIWSDVEVLTK